ncbi:MAG: hypothetical protein HOV77_32020 [Hamadaea sp.]|uniref:hypothetical protein n=1 Tax=Hamadaea sp. TaxID=2024425 RepID=UPI0017F4E0BC|nr:hypothetical protein [Hamadaea sp.]NUT23815.1 hypothetical protein [Hamadaea sp.]
MHPTLTLPRLTEPVTSMRDPLAAGRATLTRLAGRPDRVRDAFLAHYLGQILTELADRVTDPVAAELISRALSTCAANEQISREYHAALAYERPTDEDEPTTTGMPAGVVGYALGRHTR